jgi:hypothetical protein
MTRKLQAFSLVRGAQFAVGVFVAVLWMLAGERAASAQTQQFGDQRQLVITAENLFGFSMERHGENENNIEQSRTYNQFSVLGRHALSPTARGPWVGAHYFIIPNLSLGATLAFQSGGGSATVSSAGRTVTQDADSTFAFIFLPKVGYTLMFNEIIGFWFRGGPGFMSASTSDPDSDRGSSQTRWFLSVDALFVVTPVQYFGFYAGPQANISFAGTNSDRQVNGVTTSWDASFRSFSIDAGMFGYFNL